MTFDATPYAESIAAFCRRWDVVVFELFGSSTGDRFTQESDIDVLITFAQDAKRSLLDMVPMREELEQLFGRPVDLLTRPSVERSRNPVRREMILGSTRTLYAA